MSRNLTDKEKSKIKKEIIKGIKDNTFTQRDFANRYGYCRNTIRRIIAQDAKLNKDYKEYVKQQGARINNAKEYAPKSNNNNSNKAGDKETKPFHKREVERDVKGDNQTITVRSLDIKTIDAALEVAKVDMTVWEVERQIVNFWEVTIGGKSTGTGNSETYTNCQVKVWLKRLSPAVSALDELYEKIKSVSYKVPKIPRTILAKSKHLRELEISLVDIHLGLRCFKGAADIDWNPDDAEKMTMAILDELLIMSRHFGPFERIIFPLGNDFLHTDNAFGTTTAGTFQPEGDAWKNTYLRGETLALAIVERMLKEAPVKVISCPGNHDHISSITLGRLLNAYYHNHLDVEVDASMSPFKFHNYGVNLIGFEHGHSIRQQVRLAALMANECRLDGVWENARYCEWHLGDQHRKASGKPAHFEEQGVSVEFLPGLVPPNEWHRLHSFNWQKRAGMLFVWDKTAGPIARLQVNIDNYTGDIMR